MSIYKTAIGKPVTTALIFVAVIIIGLFAATRLPIDQFPEMDPPFITVMTSYPGASASEIETNVTKIIENALTSVDGLKELTSSSRDNISVVSLEMEWGTDRDEAANDIRSYIDMIKSSLPDNCSSPVIFKLNSSLMPIIQYYVTADESYPGLEKILNNEVIPQLNRIKGIGTVSVSGAPDRYIYIDLDQAKLDAYNLSLEQVANAISTNNLNLSSGTVKMEKEQYQMQVRSEYLQSSEIEDIVVSTSMTGQQVFVRDLASVRDTIKDISIDEKVNSKEAVRLIVAKKSGSNTVQVCRDVRKELAKIEKRLPSDIEIGLIYDSSENIENSISSLEESILYALLFVVLVVFFFLGNWRSTLIISITIPISLIVSFIYLMVTNSSLNIISLSALTVAIGMVVDDAIVVLENITKHIDRGSSPHEASIYATNEVWTSVIATTLVIAAVFIPLTMLTGLAGILFKELGWIVTIVVTTSTIVAISLIPMLCSQILKGKKVHLDEKGHIIRQEEKQNWYQRNIVSILDRIDRLYAKALRWCLGHKAITILAAIAFFFLTLIPVFMGKIGSDFMQSSDNGRLNVTVELQRGTRIEETLKTARTLEARFVELVPEIEKISTSAGSSDDSGLNSLFSSTTNYKISMTVVCNKKYERDRSIDEIAEVIRKEMALYPEIVNAYATTSGGMGGGNSTVDVEIYGYDFDETSLLADELKASIASQVKGARNITISRDKDRPELKVTLDKQKLAYHGLNSATVSTYIRNRVAGFTAGFLKEDGDEYDIVVRLKEDDRNSITDIQDFTIPTATGARIKLSEIAQIEEYWAPQTIERKSRQRYLRVSISPYQTSLGELAAEVQRVVDNTSVPSGISVVLAGDYEDQQDMFGDMALLLLLILLLVYIVMASQFESLSKPAIIMLSVPFALSGVILALWLTGTTLDMIGALGMIMLVGIAVKNGIVLVDYINLMRDRGYELNDAIALSGASRLRPVLMTAMTTLLGMLPMALSRGEGSEMWHPLGIVVIGGLFVSTLVTLIIVPVVYAVLSRHGERDKKEKLQKEYIFMNISTDEEPVEAIAEENK
ncbi:MAG: efflux RND transporter permease subunit [Bacteroidales bacterium]|nr:efflux RND transporter permease subunit [Bacteroidales bacterium]